MKPPWSNSQLRRLGHAIRDEAPLDEALPDYGAVVGWYDELAANVQARISSMDLAATPRVAEVEISSRAKTIGTLRDKLRRDWGMQLPAIQDVAGVRLTADMTTRAQDELAQRIAIEFDQSPDAIKDLRSTPHSGYRAVHLHLRLDEGRVEVQVRTRLQSMWANAYEALADVAGREIRYGGEPTWTHGVPDFVAGAGLDVTEVDSASDFPRALRQFSETRLALLENARNMAEVWHYEAALPGHDVSTLFTRDQDMFDVIVDLLQRRFLEHPFSDKDFDPRVDLSRPDASHHFLLLVRLVEAADVTMLETVRDLFARYRAEMEG